MRRALSAFEEKDTQVLGMSTDSRATQTAYSAALGNIPYPILSDFHPKGHVSRLYGVYDEERGSSSRAIIIVDKQGIVRHKRLYASMAEFDVADILAELDSF